MKKYMILGAFVLALSVPTLAPSQAHAYQNIIQDIKNVKDTVESAIDTAKTAAETAQSTFENGIDAAKTNIKSQIPYLN